MTRVDYNNSILYIYMYSPVCLKCGDLSLNRDLVRTYCSRYFSIAPQSKAILHYR